MRQAKARIDGIRDATMRGGLGSAFAVALLAVALGAGCGGSDGGQKQATPAAAPPSIVADPPDREPSSDRDRDARRGETEQAKRDSKASEERRVQRAAARYVDALSDADGEAVCSALVEGALDEIELPEAGRDCAASIAASIGYRDPRGVPVFAGAELVAFAGVKLSGDDARVTATVVTQFADRDEPSIEDDVIYLMRDNGRWRVVKASPTLYRAIGAADVPPDALTPPG